MKSKAIKKRRRSRDLAKTTGLKSRTKFIPSGSKQRLRREYDDDDDDDEWSGRREIMVKQLRLEYGLKPEVRINEKNIDDLLRERNDGVELKVIPNYRQTPNFEVFDGPRPWTTRQEYFLEILFQRLAKNDTKQGQVSVFKFSFAPWNTREKGYKRFPYYLRKKIQKMLLKNTYVVDELWNETHIFYGPLEEEFIRSKIMTAMNCLISQFESRGITFEILLSPSRFASTRIPIYRNGNLIDQRVEKRRSKVIFKSVFREALAKL